MNIDPALLRRLFTSVRPVAVFRNGLGVSDDEQGAVIYRAAGLRTSWAAARAAAARLLPTRRDKRPRPMDCWARGSRIPPGGVGLAIRAR